MNTRLNPYPTQNFQARQIAKAYIKGGKAKQCIELYALDSSDKNFVTNLMHNIDLKKLYPKESNYDGFKGWYNIIQYALGNIGYNNVVLAVQNKRPCGVMSFGEEDYQLHLSYLAKWRTRPNKDTSFVGKVLMHHLFDYADENYQYNICLVPSRYTPRDKNSADFYSALGFEKGDERFMNLKEVDYKQKSKELEDYFEYKKIKNAPNINPFKKFNISFKPTLMERLKSFYSKIL